LNRRELFLGASAAAVAAACAVPDPVRSPAGWRPARVEHHGNSIAIHPDAPVGTILTGDVIEFRFVGAGAMWRATRP